MERQNSLLSKGDAAMWLISAGFLDLVGVVMAQSNVIVINNVGWIFIIGAIGILGITSYQWHSEKKLRVNDRRTD